VKWTNNYGLPQPLASAIMADEYDRVGDISANGAALPPRTRQLEIRHADKIVEDVSDGIWRLIGNIGHKILERADTTNHLPEERLTARVLGWVISGKPDLLEPDMTLSDYKFPSVWAMLRAKPEWEAVANIYAWLYRENGFDVRRARIVAVLRDWSKLRAEREPDYPQVGVVVREIPLWSPEKQAAFVVERVMLHQQAALVIDDDLPLCTEEERWHKPDTWAVKKKGNKRALRVYDSELEAEEHFRNGSTNGLKLEVEHRPGADVRCQSYCKVAQWCAHGRKVQGTVSEEEVKDEKTAA
jgi:hypothetical protein